METENSNSNPQAPTPPAAPPAEAGTPNPAPPPAGALVNNGVVKSEREIELERRLDQIDRDKRAAEQHAAELERDNQDLRRAVATPPPTPPPKLRKPARLFPTIIGSSEDANE